MEKNDCDFKIPQRFQLLILNMLEDRANGWPKTNKSNTTIKTKAEVEKAELDKLNAANRA